ncbi:hypothetical protein M413DRAFT_31717 [Hebeloma cylindrosporum]|uniref:Uncharacterized protein n=1 Tax=Hebeloma cylindrosporum TaxID=76867 RepID=A0A0C2XEX3_HEBCY|nr:hypothetical protein M413DRAFT_31717 [Hebeloma cylindrosporum h7]
MGELGTGISGEELKFKEDLDRRATAGSGSEQRRKDELMRAIEARGIILRPEYHRTFPLPPAEVIPGVGLNR